MISSISWVPKGASQAVSSLAEPLSKEEFKKLIESSALGEEVISSGGLDGSEDVDDEDDEADVDIDGTSDEVAKALAVAEALGKPCRDTAMDVDDVTNGLKELDMDNYDEEDYGVGLFGSDGNLFYPSNEMDPYLKDNDDDDSEELEDVVIKPDDLVIVCATHADEVGQLVAWIYEEVDGDSNMYPHHYVIIPKFPLCTAWLDSPLKGGEKGNFVAVGSMQQPCIEIWDLDIMDEVQPCAILGGIEEVESKDGEKKKKKKKKKSRREKVSICYKEGSHTGPVLGLAWNKEYRNVLASASADKQVKIWDVVERKCSSTLEHHTDKVQAVAWNTYAPQVLLSGSFDHTVVMVDGRAPSHSGFKWSVMAEVESLQWDPHTEHSFVASLNDGTVKGFDIRSAKSSATSDFRPSFVLHAHDKEVTSISYNLAKPNLLATGSVDKMVKLWDLSNNQPSCIASQNPKAGAIFSVSFSADSPYLLAIGGSEGKLKLWDTSREAGISRKE